MKRITFALSFFGLLLLASAADAQLFRRRPPVAPPPPSNAYTKPSPSSPTPTAPVVGPAAVITSSGQYMLDVQRAYLMQEQVKRSKLDTRRKAYEEWLYERAVTPTPEEFREEDRQEQLRRSQIDPPLTEIWSAKALNDLLLDMQRASSTSSYVPPVPIDDSILKHINVTTGRSPGLGLVRSADRLPWPYVLQGAYYQDERSKVDKLLPALARQAERGMVSAVTLREFMDAVRTLESKLRASIQDISSTQYVEAKRFVTQLHDAADILQEPNVGNYFTRWQPKGNSVEELVQFMTAQGLKFAPATIGDEPYYTALHRAMANYDIALHKSGSRSMASKRGSYRR
ncbi:MAG: hypothetical protein KatS3mg105_0449 [Gemmatales bacterium]|nr:MAG: hypothetical protein KatS3mg105_0449 [Gemmatales bacterium]